MNSSPRFWNELWKALPEIRSFLDRQDKDDSELSREIGAFLSLLSGEGGADSDSFMAKAAQAVLREWDDAAGFASKAETLADGGLTEERVSHLFFPEASFGGETYEEQERFIREKRTIRDLTPNPDPVTDPASQIVFTSNVLLTLPPEDFKPRLSKDMRKRAEAVEHEEQKYWFDHPILMAWTPRPMR